MKTYLKKLKRKIKSFRHTKKTGKIALNVLFASQNSEKITLVSKSQHNYNREHNVLLLMINDDDEKYYYLAVKSKLELSHMNG